MTSSAITARMILAADNAPKSGGVVVVVIDLTTLLATNKKV